ncbi:hypothetical protein DFJ73DRAFT_811331 [Zopfochytrium polystomum]|nr:hypothetical protein DFJ73DRAFT_811331 [Zopfochytrium polystomum]
MELALAALRWSQLSGVAVSKKLATVIIRAEGVATFDLDEVGDMRVRLLTRDCERPSWTVLLENSVECCHLENCQGGIGQWCLGNKRGNVRGTSGEGMTRAMKQTQEFFG